MLALQMKSQRGIQPEYQFIYKGKPLKTFKLAHPCFPTIGQMKAQMPNLSSYLSTMYPDETAKICDCVNCRKFD